MQLHNAVWLQSLWKHAKRWRHVPLGPIRMTFKFGRRRRARPYAGMGNELRDHRASDPRQLALPTGCAVVVGMGPGLGEATAAVWARKSMPVAIVSRSKHALEHQARNLSAVTGGRVQAYAADATDERAVTRMIAEVESELGPISLLVYAVQNSARGSVLTTEVSAFEDCWRDNCLGAFIVAREAARRMTTRGAGTIVLCGATSGTIGRKGYVNFAIGKFGLRALAQVMARELGPQGVHVVHVVIDADITETNEDDGEPHTRPEDLAELFWLLHEQPKSCWTSELDVRPSNEVFWEHC
jgi:short-subunit dehydrogenase